MQKKRGRKKHDQRDNCVKKKKYKFLEGIQISVNHHSPKKTKIQLKRQHPKCPRNIFRIHFLPLCWMNQ